MCECRFGLFLPESEGRDVPAGVGVLHLIVCFGFCKSRTWLCGDNGIFLQSLTQGTLPSPSLGLPLPAGPSFSPAPIRTFASVYLPEDTDGRSRESEALGNEVAIHSAIPPVFIATMPALMGSER